MTEDQLKAIDEDPAIAGVPVASLPKLPPVQSPNGTGNGPSYFDPSNAEIWHD